MVALPALESIVIEWAVRRLGFDPRALRVERILAAAQVRLQALGGPSALEAALKTGDALVEQPLIAAATVGETYFFRQHEHFELLGGMPLPPAGVFRAWSAGCSTGEEAYSLAAALRGHFALEAGALEVWGTDINEDALNVARRAEYGRWSWRLDEAPAVSSRRAAVLDPATRACVRFARHNLLEEPVFDLAPGEAARPRFDLIFCRNVMVYFTPPAAESAVAHLRGALKPGGWLVLGNMDLTGQPVGFKRVGPTALCVYEKLPEPSAPVAALAEAREPAPPPTVKPEALRLDPVDWHAAVLAEFEAGRPVQALRELQELVDQMPEYIPGLFEYAMALRRSGRREAAADSLRRVLELARGRDLAELLPAPEALSLEFYVSSAQSFLESFGARP